MANGDKATELNDMFGRKVVIGDEVAANLYAGGATFGGATKYTVEDIVMYQGQPKAVLNGKRTAVIIKL